MSFENHDSLMVLATEVAAGKVRATEVAATEVTAAKMRAAKVSAAKMRAGNANMRRVADAGCEPAMTNVEGPPSKMACGLPGVER